MNIKKCINHGQECWRVDIGKRENGKRERKFFATRTAAEDFTQKRKEALNRYGRDWVQNWQRLSVHEQAEKMRGEERLRRLGFTLSQAADFIEESRRPMPSAPLQTVVDEFKAGKGQRGLRSRSLRKICASLEMFCDQTGGDRAIREVTPQHIIEFLNQNGWAPATRKSYLGDIRTFFRWAARMRYLAESPAEIVEAPLLEDKPPGILTVEQTKALLDACQRVRPSLLPWLCLCLFVGMRPEEANRLTWDDIQGGFINVAGRKAKTRRRRVIPLIAPLADWLKALQPLGMRLPVANWRKKSDVVRAEAGLIENWPQNAMRHSFASYHLAKHRDEKETASIMGNSPQMLFAHYRELVLPAEAEKFFALKPDAQAIAEGMKREEADLEASNARRRIGRKPKAAAAVPLVEFLAPAPESMPAVEAEAVAV